MNPTVPVNSLECEGIDHHLVREEEGIVWLKLKKKLFKVVDTNKDINTEPIGMDMPGGHSLIHLCIAYELFICPDMP